MGMTTNTSTSHTSVWGTRAMVRARTRVGARVRSVRVMLVGARVMLVSARVMLVRVMLVRVMLVAR